MTLPLKLRYPVYDLSGKELLSSGSELSAENMADLVRGKTRKKEISLPIMEHGTIASDLQKFCDQPPYSRIFSNPKRHAFLLSALNKADLCAPLFAIIDSFKKLDPYTYRHMLIVFALSMLLAQDLIEDPGLLNDAAIASPTHDLGKYCVPISVLKKSTKLSLTDRHFLEHHSAAGYVLLSYYLEDPQHLAALTARDHHERCDGSGYPRGIALDNRIIQIVAVCDVFDALIAQRPYRPTSYDLRTALEEVTDMAKRGAVEFDIVQALISYNRDDKPNYKNCAVSREKRGVPPEGNLYRKGSAE